MEETSPVTATSDILPDIAVGNSGVGKGSWCIITLAVVKEMCGVEIV
jgi:hypothetical protein